VIGQTCSTRLPRMQTYQSPLPNLPRSRGGEQSGSQWPGISRILSPEPEPVGGGRDCEPSVLVRGALMGRGGLVASQRGGAESKASALSPASTIAPAPVIVRESIPCRANGSRVPVRTTRCVVR